MGNFQYKAGNFWQDVPDYAHPDDEAGEIVIQRAEPTARDGNGLPCGAVGLPQVIIRAGLMRGDGWAWWQGFFANADALSSAVAGFTAYDPRTSTWRQCVDGKLLRPTGKCKPGGSLKSTLYSEVEIVIDGVTVV